MVYKFILVIGDCITVLLICFNGGAGIFESGTVAHILGMTVPCILLWLILSLLLKVYPPASEILHTMETKISGEIGKQLLQQADEIMNAQRTVRLLIGWAVSALLSACWLSFYWQVILKSDWTFRISPGLLLWYESTAFLFLFVWRVGYALLLLVIREAGLHFRFRVFVIVCLSLFVLSLVVMAACLIRYRPKRVSVASVPEDAPRTALVFGAGVYRNGSPSKILLDRVKTAAMLYRNGAIDRMIMSGDNDDASRNEVDMMVSLAMEEGVPESAILRDNTGYSTRDSLHHAVDDFGLTEVTLVSQRYHSLRLLLLCDRLGLDAVAVSADLSMYNHFNWMTWYVRDYGGVLLTLLGLYK